MPRLASSADAGELGRLLHVFNTEFGTPAPAADRLAERMSRLLAREDVIALLGGPPGAAVGFALVVLRPTCFVDGSAALLEELYVVEGRRGEGIGGELLGRAVEEARARGAETFEIPVDEGDTGARRFYERHGFSNRASPGADERMLLYERPLPPPG